MSTCSDESGHELQIGDRIYSKYMLQYGTISDIFEENGFWYVRYTPDSGGTTEKAKCRNMKFEPPVEPPVPKFAVGDWVSMIQYPIYTGKIFAIGDTTYHAKRIGTTGFSFKIDNQDQFEKVEPPVEPPKPECTEGDKKPGHVCVAGHWEEVTDGEAENGVLPKYLTPAEADERVRMGLPCYIKCTLPILDMLPGIPYTPGAWVLPFCAITAEP